MDAIADKAFTTEKVSKSSSVESPSLLAVILDTNPVQWEQLGEKDALKRVLRSLLIAINSHLALNSANTVVVIASHTDGAKVIFPTTSDDEHHRQHQHQHQHHGQGQQQHSTEKEQSPDSVSRSATPASQARSSNGRSFIKSQMYRQFKLVDDTFIQNLDSLLSSIPSTKPPKNMLSSSLSLALSYINKVQQKDSLVKSRILIVNTSPDEHLKYIPIMNCIFAAQKMKIPINVCQLSSQATFLQQAADATNGVYLNIDNLDGLVQYFATAFFIDPSLRNIVIKPTTRDIDFRASCFQTGKVVDIGFVCSVCLCILSEIPKDEKCPACDSDFDHHVINKLRRKPAVLGNRKKKRKIDPAQQQQQQQQRQSTTSATPTPAP
ncbi:RNA polymerase II transcription factor B subunit 4 AltName: Full=RNA polymerase II transcription factor B p34 subunit; AltName: Full=RNA polymerase II transcription factor B 34 kDa subunit [Cyberlindnera jadinii]|uniref:General transcription and DNA repair factor IIH subunit TFB4 n=1 Tax=Cyberlindnera jadinii (strain ATCC 18201 / CBS 1600 / BCRC 20928 / JCM 3617 / NBRC 0987 / NRRL Y-1542) TaxID=983966 RepID=A0A0H5C5B2_CYBJN|nr:RNA polymerase II transcription factor B subunit 4 AltName: Full=RNA polymerase II transcription factor B p34 subunit; AltName: Full=RNA polymerase II transcription factor B 34 kDa subunit [Cyberlindnera jadinii]